MYLFHRTSAAEAVRITSGQGWRSKEQPARIYFSTHFDRQAEGYGEAVLLVELDESVCELDDEFPDGEQHYAVPLAALSGVEVTWVNPNDREVV